MNKPKRRSANRKLGRGKPLNFTRQAFRPAALVGSNAMREKIQTPRSRRLRKHSGSSRPQLRNSELKFRWADAVSPGDWQTYCLAIKALRAEGIPFMLGGGFALATFTGRWRDTKDIDFYIHPRDRDRATKALTQAGFKDYFESRAYDRKWIYRSTRSGVIVDMIWAMANQRAQVDNLWFKRARTISVRGESLKVIPMEEFMWCKLYIIQRDHCDWTDVFNLLYAIGGRLDWKHLLGRLEEDILLLKGLLLVYAWLCPSAAGELPAWLWRRLNLPAGGGARHDPERDHIRLLDSRHWFAALQPDTQKLEV
jgi:hypothetical protein